MGCGSGRSGALKTLLLSCSFLFFGLDSVRLIVESTDGSRASLCAVRVWQRELFTKKVTLFFFFYCLFAIS